jgi:hypothetical protein
LIIVMHNAEEDDNNQDKPIVVPAKTLNQMGMQ